MPTINWPWAIILCQFNDVPAIPQAPDYYADLFTVNGTGGLCDYWRSVSCNTLDLTESQVFGWFVMNHTSNEVNQLRFPGDRATLVQWGLDTAGANGVNLVSAQPAWSTDPPRRMARMAWCALMPRRAAVPTTDLMVANRSAPQLERKPPVTLR